MNGLFNDSPITDTFFLGSRFPRTKSIAIGIDSVRSQEFYEISHSLFNKEKYDYDIVIFSSDNNAPVLLPPCGLYYYNYLEHYNGNYLALTIRGALNGADCGSILPYKIWHISDVSEFKMAEETIPRLFEFFDKILFVNNVIRNLFFSIFTNLDKNKTDIAKLSIADIEKHFV